MKRFFIIGAIFGFGVAFLVLPMFPNDKKETREPSKEADTAHYPYMAKRIFMGNPSDIILNFVELREQLRAYIEDSEEKIGLYFEYLPTGIHIGINDREEFYRASLVKVPLIMQLYKMIEDGYIKKDEELTVRRDLLDETYGDLWKTGAGTKKRVDELVRLTLVKSDNTAYNVLLDRVNQVLYEVDPKNEKGINNLYDYLDIPRADDAKTLQISPRSYASILKSLFFSSYLNYPGSNEILEILSESAFKDWMSGDLPSGVKVAHKVGIFQASDPQKSVNSDCGIIYVNSRPFILCIMIANPDTEKVAPYMRQLGKLTYEYVVSANHK